MWHHCATAVSSCWVVAAADAGCARVQHTSKMPSMMASKACCTKPRLVMW